MFIYNTKKRRYEAAITVYADINNPVKWLRIKLKEHSLFLIHILTVLVQDFLEEILRH